MAASRELVRRALHERRDLVVARTPRIRGHVRNREAGIRHRISIGRANEIQLARARGAVNEAAAGRLGHLSSRARPR